MEISINPGYSSYANKLKMPNNFVPAFTSNGAEFVNSKELEKYKKAQKYADSIIAKGKILNLDKCNLKKLEGIQYGIDLFDGLNMEQIRLLYKHLSIAAIFRGCSNECVHCYIDAKPRNSLNLKPDNINAMSWEDFQDYTQGFAKLDKRLGFDKNIKNPISYPALIPFLDADSMEITLKDNNGIEHDMLEIGEKIEKDLNKQLLFDTTGWSPKYTKLQKRAEKYVQHFCKEDAHTKYPTIIHVSLNPFHKLNAKYIEYINSNPEKAMKFRNLYIERMANVFYTFTPLFDNPAFGILNRAVAQNLNCDENYKVDAHKKLISEIRTKLEEKYRLNNFPENEIQKNMALFDEKISKINSKKLMATGRMKNLFPAGSAEVDIPAKIHQINTKNPAQMINNEDARFILDCNGRIYLTDFIDIIKTDICLNFKNNKDKISTKLGSIIEGTLSTDEIIKAKASNILKLLKKIF